MVTVKYFASLRQIAGKEEDQFYLNGETTVQQLGDIIAETQPQIGEMVREKKIAIAVNQDVVPLDTLLHDGDEVALLPPFSGGI